MVIAVSYADGEIGEHFGHAEKFAFYTYDGADVAGRRKEIVDCSDRHGHEQMAELMKEKKADAVITGRMGAEAWNLLLSYGIVPVPGYEGNADIAADLLITGQLPSPEGGSCSGGCGGCGSCGGCGGEESGEGCGSCGCH